MLTPEFLDVLPDTLIKLYAQAERDILMDMARRIGAYDYWIPAAEHQKQMLKEMGAAEEYIYQRLAELTGKSTEELKTLIRKGKAMGMEAEELIYIIRECYKEEKP